MFRCLSFKLCPNKCYLKAGKSKEILLDTRTAKLALRLLHLQNFELYIGNDEVGLTDFDDLWPYMEGGFFGGGVLCEYLGRVLKVF